MFRLEAQIAVEMFEPFGRIACCALQFEDFDLALLEETQSAAGVNVSASKALKLSAVYAAISLNSDTIATHDGDRAVVCKHDGTVTAHVAERTPTGWRWLADRGEFKKATLPLQQFLDTYPAHQDRAVVRNDLAVCLKRLGKDREAAKLVRA